MRIKHWAGYGCVNAKITEKQKFRNTNLDIANLGDALKLMRIEITGEHEMGIERTDSYDVFHWLLKRFDKSVIDYRDLLVCDTETSFRKVNGKYVEVCTYSLTYKDREAIAA